MVASQVLPLKKGKGGTKSFSNTKGGGGTTCVGVVLMWELEVLAIY